MQQLGRVSPNVCVGIVFVIVTLFILSCCPCGGSFGEAVAYWLHVHWDVLIGLHLVHLIYDHPGFRIRGIMELAVKPMDLMMLMGEW